VVRDAPWTFTLMLFAVAAMTTSRSGAMKAIGLALGIAPARDLTGREYARRPDRQEIGG
jgi:anaerobic C4-dicarboxylate transporter